MGTVADLVASNERFIKRLKEHYGITHSEIDDEANQAADPSQGKGAEQPQAKLDQTQQNNSVGESTPKA